MNDTPRLTPPERPPRLRVLVVEDAAPTARTIRHFLETELAVEVVAIARSGQEALLALEEHRPQVVLLDLFLPGICGLDLIRSIRERLPAARVIVLTLLGNEMRQCSLEHGADGFVVKNRLQTDLAPELVRLTTDSGRPPGVNGAITSATNQGPSSPC